jgi:hypothetical protein
MIGRTGDDKIDHGIVRMERELARRIFWKWWTRLFFVLWGLTELAYFLVDPNPHWLVFVHDLMIAFWAMGLYGAIDKRIAVLEQGFAVLTSIIGKNRGQL